MITIASLILAASTVLPNGAVMTPNNDLGRTQPVATDVSKLISSESDPNVAVTNGELWVRGERVPAGSGQSVDTNSVRALVDSSFLGGTQEVNRVTGAFDGVSDRVGRVESRTNVWNSVGDDATNYTDAVAGELRSDIEGISAYTGVLETQKRSKRDLSVGWTWATDDPNCPSALVAALNRPDAPLPNLVMKGAVGEWGLGEVTTNGVFGWINFVATEPPDATDIRFGFTDEREGNVPKYFATATRVTSLATVADVEDAVMDRVRFENLATEWIAGESYTNGQPVYVKVCLTAQKNIFICIRAHDGEDEVNFDDTEYWCPIQDYRFASQDDLHRVESDVAAAAVAAMNYTDTVVSGYRRKDEKVNWGDVTNHADFVTEAVTNGLASTSYVVAATNGIRSVDGAARPLPRYLHVYEADDSYPSEAEEYYRSRGNGRTDGGCSAVRADGFLCRNFDYPFDDRAEFVVRVSGNADGRFASVGVAQVGTNLTEQMVTSGKPEYSRLYKWLPGATVDGINENGVACNINVVNGDPQTSGWHNDTGDLHPLAAVRWALDNATNAQHAAEYIAAHIAFPPGWAQNFHYMIADETSTYIVENGSCYRAGLYDLVKPILTNFRVVSLQNGPGIERYNLLMDGANITNAWYTRAYRRETNPPWVSDLREVLADTNEIFNAWATHPKEYFRNQLNGGQPWWQTVHTSIYDLTNRVLRVAVQETDDWYVFAVPSAGGVKPEAVREIVQPMIDEAVADRVRFENLATEWIAGESYTNGQAVYVQVCLTAQKNIFICVKAHDGEDAVNFDNTEYWCPIQDYEFASQDDLHRVETNLAAKVDGKLDDDFTSLTNSVAFTNAVKTLTPAPGNYAAVSNAAMNAIQAVTNADANLIYTITSDGAEPRFYFTPVGAIDPEE